MSKARIRLAVLLAAMFFATIAQNANALPNQRSGLLTLRLEANQSIYYSGEGIELRLTVHNNTDQTYGIADGAPWQISKLVILTEEGKTLIAKTIPLGYSEGPSRYFRRVSPGVRFIWSFRDPNDYQIVKQWAKLGYWGYHLTEPGRYTITAIPAISGFQQGGQNFETSDKDRSNAVVIEIRK